MNSRLFIEIINRYFSSIVTKTDFSFILVHGAQIMYYLTVKSIAIRKWYKMYRFIWPRFHDRDFFNDRYSEYIILTFLRQRFVFVVCCLCILWCANCLLFTNSSFCNDFGWIVTWFLDDYIFTIHLGCENALLNYLFKF